MVKEIFGFKEERDMSHLFYPRTWIDMNTRFALESINGIPSISLDGFKTKYFYNLFQGRIQVLTKTMSFKQGGKYAMWSS
jgi:hypothetical protein